jgi:hypothetical protein
MDGVPPSSGLIKSSLSLDGVNALSRVRQNLWTALALNECEQENLTNGGSGHESSGLAAGKRYYFRARIMYAIGPDFQTRSRQRAALAGETSP